MIKKRAGENITAYTKAEAEGSVPKSKRYKQIILTMGDRPMTAKEIAIEMWRKGWIPNSERNFTAPRLTELSKQGVVEPVGKKRCQHTGRTVAVYRVRGKENVHM